MIEDLSNQEKLKDEKEREKWLKEIKSTKTVKNGENVQQNKNKKIVKF